MEHLVLSAFTSCGWIDREPYERSRYCLDEVCFEYYDINN